MPLPDNPQSAALTWPPAQLAPAARKLQEWSAWYSNSTDQLGEQYGARVAEVGPRVRPSQFAGGLQGTVARMFWGAPQVPGQARAKLHMPLASDIATASSDLLFAETVAARVPDDVAKANPTAPARLSQLLDGIGWDSLLPEQGELNAALGGIYFRVVFDREVEPTHPLVTTVHADAALPEFAYGRLKATTFWQVIGRDGQKVLRLLERHEAGRIEYGAYEGTDDKLGRRVDFGALVAAGITPPEVDDLSGISTGWQGLTTVYIPNMRPNRLWRDHYLCSNLGRSDYDGVEPLMDAADETITSWMRDVRLGKARIIVPEWMLRPSGQPGAGNVFNIDQEVFTGLAAPPSEVDAGLSAQITAQQFAIRTQEHADTLKGLLSAIYRGAGYSQQTFGLADEAAATATEVSSRDRRSDTTREKKTRYYTDGLAKLLRALVAVDSAQFNGGAGSDWLPTVEFPPASRPDPEVQSRSIQTLRAATVLSSYTGVKMVHPDWEESEVRAEVFRIIEEQKAMAPILPDLGALPGEEGGGDVVLPGDEPPADLNPPN